MERMPEILAPAGSYESFHAAIVAGADAVYAGGPKFGARAFAENFTEDQLLNAIDYAHLHQRKFYLTVNTLLKDYEIEQLPDGFAVESIEKLQIPQLEGERHLVIIKPNNF